MGWSNIRGASTTAVFDRVPDAWQRQRSRRCHSGHMAPNIPVRDCQNRWANRRSGVIPDDGVPRESQSELARARRIRGATRRITDVVVEQVITDRLKATARHATHSSTRSTWQACGLSQTAVASPEGLPRCKTLRLARGQRRLKETVMPKAGVWCLQRASAPRRGHRLTRAKRRTPISCRHRCRRKEPLPSDQRSGRVDGRRSEPVFRAGRDNFRDNRRDSRWARKSRSRLYLAFSPR